MAQTREECIYCLNKKALDEIMIKIADMEVSTAYLFKEQSHPGRCVLAYKDHIGQQFEIPQDDWFRFMMDARKLSVAIDKVFKPTKINFGSYGDTGTHAHWHIVPKYEGGFEFGGVFEMNPKKTYLSDAEYAEMIEKIREAL